MVSCPYFSDFSAEIWQDIFQETHPQPHQHHSCAFCEDAIIPSLNVIGKRIYLIVLVLIPPRGCAVPTRFGLPLCLCPCTQGSSSGLIPDPSLLYYLLWFACHKLHKTVLELEFFNSYIFYKEIKKKIANINQLLYLALSGLAT